jgi:GNAT superfamily N-acetyltransferase
LIRAATVDDVAVVVSLVRELAAYEREPDAVVATEDDFRAALFGDDPKVSCLVAEDDAGEVVGFAVWFVNFSTWLGRHGIYLEDLFVRPAARGSGHGRALLAELARIALERDYQRIDWWVLDWNDSAQQFYRGIGATAMDAWTVWRLSGNALTALGRTGADRGSSPQDVTGRG